MYDLKIKHLCVYECTRCSLCELCLYPVLLSKGKYMHTIHHIWQLCIQSPRNQPNLLLPLPGLMHFSLWSLKRK